MHAMIAPLLFWALYAPKFSQQWHPGTSWLDAAGQTPADDTSDDGAQEGPPPRPAATRVHSMAICRVAVQPCRRSIYS